MSTAAYWKQQLQLQEHPEGGAFREVYRSGLSLPQAALSAAHKGARPASTSIYFLLEYGECSVFHRIASDELWHFYDGDTLAIYEIDVSGTLTRHLLGRDIVGGASLQLVIPAGSWFASRVETAGGFTLCGCTVAPGFDFDDFEIGSRSYLQEKYPGHGTLIALLTH